MVNVTKIIFHDKKYRNAIWLIGEQVFQMVLSFLISVFSARYLGPSNYGSLTYTASFVAFFSSISSVGLEGVILKRIIDHPDREGEYLGNAIILRIISAFLCVIAVSLLVYVLNPSSTIKLLLVVFQSLQLVFKAFQILDSWFQRFLYAKYVAIGKMVASVIVSGYKIFLLATSKSLIWFALSNTLSDLIISLVMLCFYQKVKKQKIRVTFAYSKDLLSDSYHFILAGIMSAIYTQMDKIMIGQMLTDEDVGLYSIALTLCSLWMFIPTAIINSFKPSIMETHSSGDRSLYLMNLKKLYSGVIWICIAASVFYMIFTKKIIVILYGADYYGASGAVRIAIWSELFAMVGSAREIWILCEGKNKFVKYYLAIGSCLNLILNWLLIPIMGMLGAAVATLITQITTCLIAPLCFKETRIHTKYVIEAFFFRWN